MKLRALKLPSQFHYLGCGPSSQRRYKFRVTASVFTASIGLQSKDFHGKECRPGWTDWQKNNATSRNNIQVCKPVGRPLPDHHLREVQTHAPVEHACPEFGAELNKIGEDVAEMLEWVPASFNVVRHIRPKMCCTKCDLIVQVDTSKRKHTGRSVERLRVQRNRSVECAQSMAERDGAETASGSCLDVL